MTLLANKNERQRDIDELNAPLSYNTEEMNVNLRNGKKFKIHNSQHRTNYNKNGGAAWGES